MNIFRKSMKSIFLLCQALVLFSMAFSLLSSFFLIKQSMETLLDSTEKNVALSDIFSYNKMVVDGTYQYILTNDDDKLEYFRTLENECFDEIDQLIRDAVLIRTRVMFEGLRNMYEKAFGHAWRAIECSQNGDRNAAYSEYQLVIFYAGLIDDVVSSLFMYYTNDINAYLEDRFSRTLRNATALLVLQVMLSSVIIVLLWRILRILLTKLGQLSRFADDISRQNYDNPAGEAEKYSDNELDKLGYDMTCMADSIQKYVDIIKEKDRLVMEATKAENEYLRFYSAARDSEIKALNSQINPHFLYNTLGIVSQLCYIEKATKASRMLEAIIDAFQYITRASNSITDLKGEISFLRNYFFICRVRYENRIEFEIREATSELPNIKLPGMIIQPIVENAILHGLADCTSGGYVCVSFSLLEGKLLISIEDNGSGMNHERIEEILSGSFQDDHIGISNVIRRIRLYFGEQSDISISSEENCGTIVTIVIPIV